MAGEIELATIRSLTHCVGHDASGLFGRMELPELNLKAIGATGDVSQDVTSLLGNAILDAVSKGKRLRVPAGNYSITQIDLSITKDFELWLDPGAKLIGAAGYSTPMLSIDGTSYFPRVFIFGDGIIDNSLRTFVGAAQSGTGLSLKRLSQFTTRDVLYYGGTSYSNAVGGDSGITAQQVSDFLAVGARFSGQLDLGIYLTGGSAGDPSDSHDARIIGCHFLNCNNAVSVKRGYRRVVYDGNTATKCYAGFSCYDTGSGATFLAPGQDIVCTNNIFHRTETRAIDIRMQTAGGIVANNVVRDWGYLQDGVTVSALTYAMRLQGCTGMQITGNTVAMVDWTSTTHTAIDLPNFTAGDVSNTVYQSIGNRVANNAVSNCATGIRANGTGPNILDGQVFSNVTTPYSVSDNSYIEGLSSAGRGVGKTNIASLTTAGIGMTPDGQLNAVRSGGASVLGSRTTNAGPVAQFYLSGTLTGSLNVQSTSFDIQAQVTNGDVKLLPNGTGDVLLGTASPATSATGGFPAAPVCSGAPVGVAVAKTGYAPFVFDSVNNKLWIYNGGWKGVVLS